MAKAKRNEAKVTAWTDSGMRIDMDGGITGIASGLMGFLTEKQRLSALGKADAGVFSEIAQERAKQIKKGYDAAHDDAEHEIGVIAEGAAAFARSASESLYLESDDAMMMETRTNAAKRLGWPFNNPEESFTFEDHRAAMVKSAAMLIAAIEQYDRRVAAHEQETAS